MRPQTRAPFRTGLILRLLSGPPGARNSGCWENLKAGGLIYLDQWTRQRIRAIQLKQWKRGTTAYRQLLKLGASSDVAAQVAANTRRWWRNSGRLLNSVLDMKWANQLGGPRLC